ncbi:MAG: hypothetical protein AB1921_13395 [Thermodesulfobacteriota bacterium]
MDMGSLSNIMLDTEIRGKVVADCAELVDGQVAAKKGASGLLIKAGYKAFKAVKPGMLPGTVDHFLNDFVAVLDKHWDAYAEAGKKGSFSDYLKTRADGVAEDLLSITDRAASSSEKGGLRKTYEGLRKIGKPHVAAAVPALAALVERYAAAKA